MPSPSPRIADRLSWLMRPLRSRIARCRTIANAAGALEPQLSALGDDELLERSLSLRFRAKTGENLGRLMPEAFALVREAARRTVGMRHYDVQLIGGAALAFGAVAEMETGEGKTLAATLPLYLHALAGRGTHLATANDYLARRDADLMRPVFGALGLSVGAVDAKSSSDERRRAYACDVTYGTAKEFGFDFLRDRLTRRAAGVQAIDDFDAAFGTVWESLLQRGPHFALVDEADSVLIDEARTPLVIGLNAPREQASAAARFRWCAEIVPGLNEGEHFEVDPESRQVWLTPAGRHRVRGMSLPAFENIPVSEIYESVERAVHVDRELHRDRHYVVRGKEVIPVDEATGRLAEGRKWRRGVHQAVEAKESLPVTLETAHAACVSIQQLFLRYRHLAGMTGTARSAAAEFRRIYRRAIFRIPTNRPVQRVVRPACVFATADDKWQAVVNEVRAVHATGQPVLIGTRSIEQSERLSRRLTDVGIAHAVLNARQSMHEAGIVARAGEKGRVTVATNMAGRGTDIRLGEGVAELGGLSVIGTELHDSARIDRQLEGRCGRQGDPGCFRQFVSLEDDVLREAYGSEEAVQLRRELSPAYSSDRRCLRELRRAQAFIERRHFYERKRLLAIEAERQRMAEELGQDPYLDLTDE